MTPEKWARIKELLATALDLPVEQRVAFVSHAAAGDVELRNEVNALLERERNITSKFLDQNSLAEVAAACIPTQESPWIGRRVGAYQIEEQIGAGGMGEVYRAFRADDQYRKEVALKVIRAGQDSGLVITRFRNERQILAALDHPNIARLLDGGTTPEGTPYIVMELVSGQQITEYCDEHRLSIHERLELFLKVCSAVQYAHQHLTIHRDIKPGNILVTADGTPKLLDFGIAKVLGSDLPAEQNQTLTLFHALTPEYASPEQVNGSPVTTASDVYSLGVVLYVLLAGRSPYPASARTSQELATAITALAPEKPSLVVVRRTPEKEDRGANEVATARGSASVKLQSQLRGDLDNIVLMALRKEPERRYSSAEQFAADIRRYLEHIPVLARKDTAFYRTSKFVRRHKVGVFATALVILAIVGGLAGALYEAHIARQQAEIARAQRLRAERRFNDVRRLANSLMFEIHDSIRDLPGATSARKLLVNQALSYLDSLSQEATDDMALQRELAAAYDRMGDVLGYNGAANLGDFAGAIQSYKKALAIRETYAAANPHNQQIQSELFGNYFRLSFALDNANDQAGALADLQKALPVAQWLASTSDDPRFQDWLAGVHWQAGNILGRSNQLEKALDEYRSGAAIREPLAQKSSSILFRTHLAADLNGMGQMLARIGDTRQAIDVSRKAMGILEEISGANHNDATLREYLGETYSLLQTMLQIQGNLDESLALGQKSRKIFIDLSAQDPTNALAAANIGFTEIALAETLLAKGRHTEASTYARHAENLFINRNPKTPYDVAGQAESYFILAKVHEAGAQHEVSREKKAAQLREAESLLLKSVHTWQQDAGNYMPDALAGRDIESVQRELAHCRHELARL